MTKKQFLKFTIWLICMAALVGVTICKMSEAQERPKPCHRGDLVVRTISDIEELQTERCVRGDVVIINTEEDLEGELSLPTLRWVGGDFIVENNSPRSDDAPLALTNIDAPLLWYVGGIIWFEDDWDLPCCEALDFIDGVEYWQNYIIREVGFDLCCS
jgi:hypothetical protein